MSKKLIWQGFYNLLVAGNNYKEISVRGICQKVGIHHTSFYYHFQDKQQLFEYGLNLLLTDYFKIAAADRFKTPFTLSDSFYHKSSLINLIEAQKYDVEGTLLITNWAKEEMIRDGKRYLINNSDKLAVSLDYELIARQLVETIFVISRWQENKKYQMSELDHFYLLLVEHLLPC